MPELKNIVTIHIDVDEVKDFIASLVKDNPKINKALVELLGTIVLNSKKEDNKNDS